MAWQGEIRPAQEADRRPLALLFAAVAEERDGIAAEPLETPFGFGELGMFVAADQRGRGVGTALVAAAIDWARARGLHKLALSVFPHNEAAIGLYRKIGFVEEGLHRKHMRRASGELRDLLDMGLLL